MLGWAFVDNGIAGLIIALVIWFFMNLFAYFQGGSMVLAISGARKIGPDDHPRLWNVVEEMKIASGLEKMPDVYIIDDPALNAFATGRDPKHAAVAVTSGLLQKMNRDELQGVVAHEMSHIKNRDVLLMTLCSVTLGTIVILAWYGTRVMIFSGGGRGRRDGGGGGAADHHAGGHRPGDTGAHPGAAHLLRRLPKEGIPGGCLRGAVHQVSRRGWPRRWRRSAVQPFN